MGILDFFLDLFYYAYIKPLPAQQIGLVVLLLAAGLIYYFRRRAAGGHRSEFRDLPAAEELRASFGEDAPVGAKIHVALGSGGVADAHTAETMVGIQTFGHLARQASAVGIPTMATAGNVTTLPVLDNVAISTFEHTGNDELLRPENRRFVAQDPVAYAAGVMRVLSSEDVTTNVMVGSFGDEYLLMGEVAARRGVNQIVAATDPYVAPFAYATGNSLLLGEEMFALGAYLERQPSQVAGVLAQDWLRLAIIAAVVALVIAASFGLVIS